MKPLLPALLLGALYGCQGQPAQPAADAPAQAPPAAAQPAEAAPAPAEPAADAPALEPGVAIGPFKLGATLDELTAAGHKLDVDPSGQFGDTVKVSGPYRLVFSDDGKLTSVELDLTQSPLRHGAVTLSDKTPSDELMKALDCGPLERLEGGNTATCADGVVYKQGGPVLKPSVQLLAGSP
jgi:hypothetical protein